MPPHHDINREIIDLLIGLTKESYSRLYVNSLISNIKRTKEIQYLENQKCYIVDNKVKYLFQDDKVLLYENFDKKYKNKHLKVFEGTNKKIIERTLKEQYEEIEKEISARKIIKNIIEKRKTFLLSQRIDIKVDKVNNKMYDIVRKNEKFQIEAKDKYKEFNLSNYPDYLKEIKDHSIKIKNLSKEINNLYNKIDVNNLPIEIKDVFKSNYQRFKEYCLNIENQVISESNNYLDKSLKFIEEII